MTAPMGQPIWIGQGQPCWIEGVCVPIDKYVGLLIMIALMFGAYKLMDRYAEKEKDNS